MNYASDAIATFLILYTRKAQLQWHLSPPWATGQRWELGAIREIAILRLAFARTYWVSRCRVIICPVSLKAEWEEQIARSSGRASPLVLGPRAPRLLAYRKPAFFTIVNYEQVLIDADEINSALAPEVIVLDEAQQIKNWQTKTARRVITVALCVRTDRYTNREPRRRALFHL